jgi:hypothetical protein
VEEDHRDSMWDLPQVGTFVVRLAPGFGLLVKSLFRCSSIQKYGIQETHTLQNFGKKLHNSHILKTTHPFMLDVLEKGGCKTRDLLKLIGKRCYAAIMKPIRYFGERKLVIDQQLLCPFDLMFDNELLDRRAFDLGKDIGEIGIVVI